MDQSLSESDLSMSPTQILERLQLLRNLQLIQQGKLQKHQLTYGDSIEKSETITEIVSHFSNSTSYNTFKSLLQSSELTPVSSVQKQSFGNGSSNIKEVDLIEGVSVLNTTHESEKLHASQLNQSQKYERSQVNTIDINSKKIIQLDEIPILSPHKDFSSLLQEKLLSDKNKNIDPVERPTKSLIQNKKSFLKRGEGMARFGLRKTDLVIQNTKALPWRKDSKSVSLKIPKEKKSLSSITKNNQISETPKNINTVQIANLKLRSVTKDLTNSEHDNKKDSKCKGIEIIPISVHKQADDNNIQVVDSSKCDLHKPTEDPTTQLFKKPNLNLQSLKGKKEKTWASILTKEQDEFLRQLKQSDYYKNFASPAKSAMSDLSYDESFNKASQEKKRIDQNMFELLENKVSHESFNLNSTFFNKFLRKSQLECSGESTPLVLQKCLSTNPNLLHIFPDPHKTHTTSETNASEYTDCDHETCSSVSSCCSCKTVELCNQSHIFDRKVIDTPISNKNTKSKTVKEIKNKKEDCQENVINDNLKSDMAEMNAKLVATSELLKDRLKELEDEIETFRKENANLSRMKEEMDIERQKFYEEKAAFEQKFNEERILNEYHLAEEKENLTKQKQVYERYVREMRGRLNKKDKEEVVNLKAEVNRLKEEIRIKDAKSTSTIARLRNQLKIFEKDKSSLQDEIEKLKKENRRLHHSNEMTRRMTNIKYLEEINKRLTSISAKESKSDILVDNDIKYKSYEIERQSRSRRVKPDSQHFVRPRAKSVPNLKVTSRYAKYFSQRDVVSQLDKNKNFTVDRLSTCSNDSDKDRGQYKDSEISLDSVGYASINDDHSICDNEVAANLEKLYVERFKTTASIDNTCSAAPVTLSHNDQYLHSGNNSNNFFISKPSSADRNLKSPNQESLSSFVPSISTNRSKSPRSVINSSDCLNNNNGPAKSQCKSPVSIQSNQSNQYSSESLKTDMFNRETSSKSSLTKSNLNPIERIHPDGTRELRFPNGNVKYIAEDGKYTKFVYYNGDIKENFYDDGRIKYFYAETKTFHTNHADGLEVLEFPDGQVEKRYKDGSSEIRLPNGSVRYHDPKNKHVREEWRFPDGTTMTVSASGEQRVVFSNGQIEVHAKDHKRREFPDGTVKLVYNDGTSETRYASGRVRVKDKHGNLIMDSAQ